MTIFHLICSRCNAAFIRNTSPANAKRQKFCGKKCAAESLRERVKPLIESLKERLENRSAPQPNGCIIYTGQSNGQYGQIEYRRKTYLAHRAAFMVFKGEIPKGKCVCHSCDVRLCINPEHLWIGTYKENVRDMYNKGRQKHNPIKKLSDAQIQEIHKSLAKGEKQKDIAKMVGVSRSYISMLKLGIRRTNLKPT